MMANTELPIQNGTTTPSAAVPTALPLPAEFGFANNARLISPDVLITCVKACEFLVLAGVGLLIALLYVPQPDIATTLLYPASPIVVAIVAVIVMDIMGLYKTRTIAHTLLQIPSALTAWTVALAALVAAVFFLKAGGEISRIWLFSWFLAGAGSLVFTRSLLHILTRKWAKEGRLNKRIAIYGAGPQGEALLHALEHDPEAEIRICGVFDDRRTDRHDDRNPLSGDRYSKPGTLRDLIDLVRATRIDMIILAVPLAAEKRLKEIVNTLAVLPVDIRLAGSASELRFNPRAYSFIGNVAVLDLMDKPISDWGGFAKSLFDRTIGLLALILLAPLMAAVAIAIRLDSKGPVLFRQKRYGFNNELIEIYKFRSMYVDLADAQAAKLVTKNDPRVTPIGRFIRKTSIDELPQLLNVLKGDLSLVGPRPHALQAKAGDKLYDTAVANYFTRHKVKPGITGWAQINGWRGETDTEEKLRKRVEHDLYYIENWSLFFDVYILAMTPLALLKTENAY